jgi:hypothetical protein
VVASVRHLQPEVAVPSFVLETRQVVYIPQQMEVAPRSAHLYRAQSQFHSEIPPVFSQPPHHHFSVSVAHFPQPPAVFQLSAD